MITNLEIKFFKNKTILITGGTGSLGNKLVKYFLVNNKDRIAQMILAPVVKIELEETNNLPETIRGEGGFGSTGK